MEFLDAQALVDDLLSRFCQLVHDVTVCSIDLLLEPLEPRLSEATSRSCIAFFKFCSRLGHFRLLLDDDSGLVAHFLLHFKHFFDLRFHPFLFGGVVVGVENDLDV